MSDWTPYQTDYLFLLIGANPLPNYVAALLLAKDNGTIYLLHSAGAHGTGKVAASLKQAIQNRRPQVKVVPREIDEADSSRIAQKMAEILSAIVQTAAVGLHYTGGTKAMAIHVYRAVEKAFPSGVFSYLDARTLSLMIDGRGGTPVKSIPVGRACEIQLEELVALHGREMKPPGKDANLPHVHQRLVDLHVIDPETWRAWCDANLRRSENKSKFKSKTDLAKVEIPMDNIALASVFASWGGNLKTLEDVSLPQGWKIEDLAKWLDGSWLEHYVLDCVKQVASRCDIHDYGMSLKPKSGGQGFEFDVAAMRGYQLFALSCTTDTDKGMCKLKLFEAYTRARQMGGDEARVALVCCYHDPLALRQEIEETWFTEGRVEVFGMTDLLNLPTRLREWFEAANQ